MIICTNDFLFFIYRKEKNVEILTINNNITSIPKTFPVVKGNIDDVIDWSKDLTEQTLRLQKKKLAIICGVFFLNFDEKNTRKKILLSKGL